MTAKEYLLQIKEWDKSLKRKLEKLEKLKSRSTRTTVALGNEGGTGVHKQDTMEDAIIDYIELELEIQKDIDEFSQFKLQVSEQIDKLEDQQQIRVLFYRHLELLSWKQVAGITNQSIKTCQRLEQDALENLNKFLVGPVLTHLNVI